MKHRMQTLRVLGSILLVIAGSARAADTWTTTLGNTTANWNDAEWYRNAVKVTDGSAPGNPLIPGAASDVVSIANPNSQYLYLQGNRTLDILNFTDGTTRLRSGTSSGNTASTLTVNTININKGIVAVMNRNAASSLLTIVANTVNVTGGNLSLGEYNQSGTSAVSSFTAGTTTISASRILGITNPSFSTINLGLVNNAGTLDLAWKGGGSGSPNFNATTPYTVVVSGLTGAGLVTTSVTAADAAARPTLEINGTGSNNFTGLIEDGMAASKLALVKKGSGIQYLRNADNLGHTYSGGTVIAEGTLAVANITGSGLGTGAVTIKNSGVFAARYRTRIELGLGNSIHVESGGTVKAGIDGTHGAAKLTLVSASNGSAPVLIMDEGGIFEFRIGLSGTSDLIEFTDYESGDLVLNNNVVNFLTESTELAPGMWKLFAFSSDVSSEAWWDGTQLTIGTGLGEWMEHASFVYQNDGVYLQIIPEPHTALLCLSALGSLLVFGRKGRRG